MAKFTKKAIVDTFVELLNEKPFSQITVKEITERCEINHNTFYYYFEDIYAVIDEIFAEEHRRLNSATFASGTMEDACNLALNYINTHRKAIRNLYNSVSRDRLERYLIDVADRLMEDFTAKYMKDVHLSEEDKRFFVTYQKCALIGFVIWQLERGSDEDLEYAMRCFSVLTEDSIRRFVEGAAETLSQPPVNGG
jgi:AcrR family transcriptional regulator